MEAGGRDKMASSHSLRKVLNPFQVRDHENSKVQKTDSKHLKAGYLGHLHNLNPGKLART
jgi:hypothetical protein